MSASSATVDRSDGPGAPSPTPPDDRPTWHRLETSAVLDQLATSRDGLDDGEAARRLAADGPNELLDRGSKSPWRILWEQLTAVMVVILLFAAALSLVLGKYLEAGAIAAIVVLFSVLGFLQEYRAEQAIAALRRMAVPSVRAVRGGRSVEIPAVELVRGDVVVLEAGNVVPADLRLIEAASLRIQEAALTGESEPVDKTTDTIQPNPGGGDVALGDRRNLAFSGTQVTLGRGLGVVVGTGMGTELGRIADLLQEVGSQQTPLQQRLDRVGKQLALAGVLVALLVVAIGLAAGEPLGDMILTAISVAVAVIPEGLPAVVTFTLAIGAQRMLKRNALIRKLPAVETLGSVTVICSDKTGTLTQNRMRVAVVDTSDGPLDIVHLKDTPADELPTSVRLTLIAGLLCNDGELHPAEAGEDEPSLTGDPTETALLLAAHHAGFDVAAAQAAHARLAELPFDADRKRMTTVHAGDTAPGSLLHPLPGGRPLAFVKGAPDRLLALADEIWLGDGAVALDDELRERVRNANDGLAAGGMRVLAVAYRSLDRLEDVEDAEQHLVLLGLAGIIDPPRDEVRGAVATCQSAGIRTVMITGDHPLTANAIAKDLGMRAGDDPTSDGVLTGAELDRIDDEGLDAAVEKVSVYARVSPEHKLRIVSSLRRKGEVVAMTGDGVNDAPALKQADIGVAMGITGTDVSKEASDMVLRDDNFATIVASVEEGRVIYDNLRRFVRFAVAGNIGKMIVMVAWPLPFLLSGDGLDVATALLPLQLLWLNLMTDGILGLSMGLEPAEKGIMRRPPHKPGSSIWAGGLGWQAAWVGTLIGVAALAVGYLYFEADRVEWQTMMVVGLTFLQVFQAIGSRSDTQPLWKLDWRANPLVPLAVAVVLGLMLLALYTPLNGFLDLEPLSAADLGIAALLGVVLLVAMEASKAMKARSTS
ncbi:MAG: cation-translocating P-type ATPase [Acidimicrobiales bacterium]